MCFRQWRVLVLGIAAISLCVGHGKTARSADGYSYDLFDGRSLDGWTIENDCHASVRDGMIFLESGNGWIRTDRVFADFKLHVEWKALKEADYDSGIYLRTIPGGKPFPKRSYQANLLEGQVGHIKNLKGATVSKPLAKPAGEWNSFDITVIGDTLTLEINSQRAYQVRGVTEPVGHIGIQAEVPKGGQFYFRNLRITEFRHQSLFNGKDFTGWEHVGHSEGEHWQVESGVLSGRAGKGPWLRSDRQFDDFNLRLQYRVVAGGNSGIYVRVPPDGNHHRDDPQQPPAGFEIQILDDSASRHAKLKDYQYCGSIYDICGAARHVGNSPGEWNRLELNCLGNHITVIHNGQVIVDATQREFPLLALRQPEGYLGLQQHGGGVSFRRLRIGPALAMYPGADEGK